MPASSAESPAVSRTRPLAARSHSPAVPVVGAASPSARLICTRKSDSVTPIPWSESPKCPSSPCQGSGGIFFVIVMRESQASRAGLPANLRHCGRLVSPRVIEAARLEADWLEHFRGVSVGTLSSRRLRQTRRDEWETKTLLANSLSTRSLSGSRRRSGARWWCGENDCWSTSNISGAASVVNSPTGNRAFLLCVAPEESQWFSP